MHIPILTVPQTRESEQLTMQTIPSTELMERAGTACAEAILPHLGQERISCVYVFCGTGNNGGDGIVVARRLVTDPRAGVDQIGRAHV